MGPALELGHRAMAAQVDQPIAALLKDLKARGILDETLVIWAGEFGRTPFFQGSNGLTTTYLVSVSGCPAAG